MAEKRQLQPAIQGRYMVLSGVRLLIAAAIGAALAFGVSSADAPRIRTIHVDGVSIMPAPPTVNPVCYDDGCLD
jgi:hypothetical protein